MGTFSQFLDTQKITPPMIIRVSARLEAAGKEGRTLSVQRATKRRTAATKSYADAGLAKPPAGRALSVSHIQNAMADVQLPRKVRAKLVRAIGAILEKKKAGAVDTKALFGEIAVKKGKKIEKAAAV